MHLKVVRNMPPDPIDVQDFLATIEGVHQATVWWAGQNLLARVTVNDWSLLTEIDLRQACIDKLGPEYAPSLLMLERISGDSAERAA